MSFYEFSVINVIENCRFTLSVGGNLMKVINLLNPKGKPL